MRFRTGLGLPEAPVLLDDGSLLVTEMAWEAGRITRIAADGSAAETVTDVIGRPNGLALDADGVLWVAESLEPSLLRVTLDGRDVEVVASGDGETRMQWPNDLAFGPDGLLYMTDSGVLVRDFLTGGKPAANWADLPLNGRVWRIDPRTGEASVLDDGIRFTNGIAFGPDDRLYVAETMSGTIYRYALHADGLGRREAWASVLDPAWQRGGLRGPDGMKFADDGRLFVTVFGQGDVTVLAPDGGVATRIPTEGKAPTNLVLGDGRFYVTEDELGQVEVYDADARGLPLHRGR